jgi:hypothetical protein
LKKVDLKYDVGYKKSFLSFEAILVLKILNSPHNCRLTFLSIEGPFFSKLALVEQFKENYCSLNFDPFLAVCNSQVVNASVLKLSLIFNQVVVHASAKS